MLKQGEGHRLVWLRKAKQRWSPLTVKKILPEQHQRESLFLIFFITPPFNPFTAWPGRVLDQTVYAICPGLEYFWAVGKCTFGFVVEGKQLLQAYPQQLDLPPFYFPLCWPKSKSDFFFGGGGVNVLLCCHFCIMATDQRRYHLHLIEFGILNEILNDASSGYQTFVQKQR